MHSCLFGVHAGHANSTQNDSVSTLEITQTRCRTIGVQKQLACLNVRARKGGRTAKHFGMLGWFKGFVGVKHGANLANLGTELGWFKFFFGVKHVANLANLGNLGIDVHGCKRFVRQTWSPTYMGAVLV